MTKGRKRKRSRRRSTGGNDWRMGVELAGCFFVAALAAHILLGDPCSQTDPFNAVRYLVEPDSAVSACISELRGDNAPGTAVPAAWETATAADVDMIRAHLHLIPENIKALCNEDCRAKLRAKN